MVTPWSDHSGNYSTKKQGNKLKQRQHEIGRNYPINIGIIADAKAVLRQMIQETQDTYGERKELPWVEECREQLRQREVRNEALMNSGSVPVLCGKSAGSQQDGQ